MRYFLIVCLFVCVCVCVRVDVYECEFSTIHKHNKGNISPKIHFKFILIILYIVNVIRNYTKNSSATKHTTIRM